MLELDKYPDVMIAVIIVMLFIAGITTLILWIKEKIEEKRKYKLEGGEK